MRFYSKRTVLLCFALALPTVSCGKKKSSRAPARAKSNEVVTSQGKIENGHAIISFNLPKDSLDDYKCRLGLKRNGVEAPAEYTACPASMSYDVALLTQEAQPGDTFTFSMIDQNGDEVTSTHLPVQSEPPSIPPLPMEYLPQAGQGQISKAEYFLDESHRVVGLDSVLILQAQTIPAGSGQSEVTQVTKSTAPITGVVSSIFNTAVETQSTPNASGASEYSATLSEVQKREDHAEVTVNGRKVSLSLVSRNTLRLAKLNAEGVSTSVLNIMSLPQNRQDEKQNTANLFYALCKADGARFVQTLDSKELLSYSKHRTALDASLEEKLVSDKAAVETFLKNNETSIESIRGCLSSDNLLITSVLFRSSSSFISVDLVEAIELVDDATARSFIGAALSTSHERKQASYWQDVIFNRSAALLSEASKIERIK